MDDLERTQRLMPLIGQLASHAAEQQESLRRFGQVRDSLDDREDTTKVFASLNNLREIVTIQGKSIETLAQTVILAADIPIGDDAGEEPVARLLRLVTSQDQDETRP